MQNTVNFIEDVAEKKRRQCNVDVGMLRHNRNVNSYSNIFSGHKVKEMQEASSLGKWSFVVIHVFLLKTQREVWISMKSPDLM